MADNSFKINKSANFNPQAGLPANPIDGDFFYDSTAQSFAYFHNGSWANFDSVGTVASVTNMTGAQLTPAIVRNSVIKITGTGVFPHLCGLASSFSGKQVTVYNASDHFISVEWESGLEATANNRIRTPTGGSMNLIPGEVAVFTYDIVVSRWLLVSISSQSGAQVPATTTSNGLVSLHQASATPFEPIVFTDGDYNTPTGFVGLDANRAAFITPTIGNTDALTLTGLGLGNGLTVYGGSGGGIGVIGLGGPGAPGLSGTGGNNADGVRGVGTINGYGGYFTSGNQVDFAGVYAVGGCTTDISHGVEAQGGPSGGNGVVARGTGGDGGIEAFGSGIAPGLHGYGGNGGGAGVFGQGIGLGHGVQGNGGSLGGYGVYGRTALGYGVAAQVTGGLGLAAIFAITAGVGQAGIEATGGPSGGQGIIATGGSGGSGVKGVGVGVGKGVEGESSGGIGVLGTAGGNNYGVKGIGSNAAGVYGQAGAASPGVEGLGNAGGAGVLGTAGATGNGVEGIATSSTRAGVKGNGGTTAMAGVWGTSAFDQRYGVYGENTAATANGSLAGYFVSSNGRALQGTAVAGAHEGVYGLSQGTNGIGVYGLSQGTNGIGGYFEATGTGGVGLVVGAGNLYLSVAPPASNVGVFNTLTQRNICKAWGNITTGGTYIVTDGFFISGIAASGNNVRVTLAGIMASTDYCVIATMSGAIGSPIILSTNVISATVFDIGAYNSSGAGATVNINSTSIGNIHFAVFGIQ